MNPAKKKNYQAIVRQKLKEKQVSYINHSTPQIRKNSAKNSPSTRMFSCYVLICIIIGVGIIIGINRANQPQNPENPSQTTTTSTFTGTQTYGISGSIKTIHSETIPLSSFQGKTLLLYFTGASCIPCKAQLPYLVDAYNQYKSSGKLEVVSLDIQGQTIDKLLTWEEENGITWKVCQDTGLVLSSKFSIYSMPTLVICDQNGKELNRYVGSQSQSTINTIFQNAFS